MHRLNIIATSPHAAAIDLATSATVWRRTKTYACVVCLSFAFLCGQGIAVEPQRIWVDVTGTHSVQARLVELTDDSVFLLKKDGKEIEISLEMLSDRDREYVEDLELPTTDPVDETTPAESSLPQEPTFKPLPVLQLPRANRVAAESSVLSFARSRDLTMPTESPVPISADPAPTSFGVMPTQIAVQTVDLNDTCSRPIPILTTNRSGLRESMIAMSVSSKAYLPGEHSRNELIRFDTRDGKAHVALQHSKTIRLMDHHNASGRSLVLIGFNSLGQGGELAVASGWDTDRVRLHHRRTVTAGDKVSRLARVRWARWVDKEHVLAVIDQTLGMWNLVSGEQIFGMDGIDPRGLPAISGGRRVVAVPFPGHVSLFATETGRALGRLNTQGSVPGLAFSPQGNRLAVVATRRLQNWDLPSATMEADIASPRGLGKDEPTWISSDLILASSGVLVSSSRGVPIWRYDVTGAQTVEVGRHLVMFRRHPTSELSVLKVPHEGVLNAIHWIDNSPTKADTDQWHIPGRSVWNGDNWDDLEVQLSAAPRLRR